MTIELQRIESEKRLWELKQTLEPDSAGFVAEMVDLADIYYGQGRYESAESLYHRVTLSK
jgi:hypothetical protein